MIDYTSSQRLMENVSLGEGSPSWPLYPALDTGGKIQLLPGEEVLAVQSAKRVTQEGFAMPDVEDFVEMVQHLQERKILILQRACVVYVTNLRTAWTVTKPLLPGALVSGHVWHAWLDWVEFNPRQSFFIDASLSLHLIQDFCDGTSGWFGHFIEFGFDKKFDPAQLATTIAHAAANHRLGSDAPEATREELRTLAASPPPPPPTKGESAIVTFPTRVNYPLLPETLDSDHVGEWTVPSGGE